MNSEMDGSDQVDDRTFRANFSGDGVVKLRERVNDKLKEFLGDYTDDTLVEYVIVLLRNGRQKEEARNELNVFLGDDSDSFVSWLWDHLSSNLHLYVQQRESYPDEVAKTKPMLGEQAGRNDSHQLDSESDREKYTKESKSRRNREWKGLVRDVAEPPPLRSSEIDSFHSEGKSHHKLGHLKRSRSPRPTFQNKRSRQDERHQMKREVPSHPVIDVPCRLLQSAMRDAVGTVRSSGLRMEPTLKRLRSVVSTSAGDSSLDDKPQRVRSVARLPSAVITAFKAAAEAAEDVTKARCSGNVFDRLGHGMDVSGMTNQSPEFEATHMGDAAYEDFDQMPGVTRSDHLQRNECSGEFAENTAILDRDAGMEYDYASDNDGYDDYNVIDHSVMDASQTGTSSVNKDEDSLMVRYSVAKNTNEFVRRSRVKDQTPPADVANTSRKIVNISVNVNTWKPPHYQTPRDVREVENLETIQGTETVASKPGVRLMNENSNTVVAADENEKPGADTHKESQKTLPFTSSSYSVGRPSEDTDSRTIFVGNVHFAATKDALSRHFNKCGEVLKVVIMTDAATGQPKGSAYVEFMRKEAAELALSLNGTSFMSRILKVIRKSLAYQEASNIMTWPRVARVSPFAARLSRAPFPRGIPGAFRAARLPIKSGPRSWQWKRDAPATAATESTTNVQNGAPFSNNFVLSPTARNLTYVRK